MTETTCKRIRIIVVFALVYALYRLTLSYIAYNYSESMPIGIYLVRDCSKDLIGKTVIVKKGFAERKQKKISFYGIPIHCLMKKVYGKAGDVVDYDVKRKVITINGEAIPNTEIQQVGSDGKPLPQMKYPYVIAEGRYFVATERKCGYDSRYFGTVSGEAIQREALPIFVKEN